MSKNRPTAAIMARRSATALAAVFALIMAMMAWQVAMSPSSHAAAVDESFANATPAESAWIRLGAACLTDATSGPWACDRDADPTATNTSRGYGTPVAGGDGTGFLQLTDNRLNTNGGVVYNEAIAASQGLAIEFTQYQYGPTRNREDRRAADGIGFFLVDGAANLTETGPIGGSLGYGPRRDQSPVLPGIANGYLGVGLDTFGNFANQGHVGGTDCPAPGSEPASLYGGSGWNTLENANALYTNNISLRGPGNGTTGYCLLAREKLDTIGSDGSVADTFSPHVPGSWGSKSLWAGDLHVTPTQSDIIGAGRKVRIVVSPVANPGDHPTVTVSIDYSGTGNNYEEILSETVPAPIPAAGFKFGFSASTGNNTGSHLIGSLSILNAPGAEDDTVTLNQGETANFTAADLVTPGASQIPGTDAYRLIDPNNGNPVTSVDVPGEGTWTINPNTGEVTFVPASGFTGPVTPIDYRVTDSSGQSADGQLSVIYRPEAADDIRIVQPGSTGTFDVEDDLVTPGSSNDLTYTLLEPGTGNPVTTYTDAHGGVWTINPSTGETTYQAHESYRGPVPSIDYRVTDGNNEIATGTLSIIVPPLAEDETKAGNPGDAVSFDPIADLVDTGSSTDITITLESSDPGDPNTLTVPGEGTWTLVPGTGVITFTPEPGFTDNPAPIQYRATDGNDLFDTATLTVEYNVPPQAGDQTVTVNPGDPATLHPVITPGTDPNPTVSLDNSDPGDPTRKTVPGEGVWTIDPGTGQATFTPEPGFTDNPTPVTYTVTDSNGLTDSGTLTVLTRTPPTANDQSKTTQPGTPVDFDPPVDLVTPGSDSNIRIELLDPSTGDPVPGNSVTVPGEGTWTVDPSTGKVTFTPADGFTGTATLRYRATDGNDLYDEAQLSVTIPASDSGAGDDDSDDTDNGRDDSDDDSDEDSGNTGRDRDELARTGATITATAIGAFGLLLLGAGLIVITRRRVQV